jgi:hypothetical protein
MADYTTFNVEWNKGSDATPDWTGTALAFGGSAGANEFRFAPTGGASWPSATKPASGTAVFQEGWSFTADTTGLKTTYTGDNTVARVLRFNWDALGTFASSPQFSCFDSTAHNTPSPGTQPSIVNGSSDTSNKSYIKLNAYGRGANSSGSTQDTPAAGSVGSNPSATTGTAGSVSPPTTPAWLTNWQDGQGWTDYIVDAVTPQALFAAKWYITCVLFYGANISAATYTFVLTLQYTFS